MTRTTVARRLAFGWPYLPATSAPIGGGLIKICGASTWAAVSVGLAPYAIWAAMCAIFLVGYLGALIRYICSGQDGQDAMTCLIKTSSNAIVSILTLTPADSGAREVRRAARPPDAQRLWQSGLMAIRPADGLVVEGQFPERFAGGGVGCCEATFGLLVRGAARRCIMMLRNHILTMGEHHFTIVLEESVLRYRLGNIEVMAGQLGHLLSLMSLPSVSLGVIPFSAADRPMWTLETFTVFDDARVHVELLAAQVTVTAPGEVTLYLRAFDKFKDLAVYGQEARALITAAITVHGLVRKFSQVSLRG